MAVKYLEDPYYYWYETLRRSDEANWYDRMKANLKLFDTYEEWYETYKKSFAVHADTPVFVIDDLKQYEPNNQYGLTVSIQLTYPANEILDAVKNLLKEYQSPHRGRLNWDDLGDIFQLSSVADCPTLKILLDVYDLLNVPEASKPSFYEVGMQLELSPKSVIEESDSPKDIRDKTTTMNSLVSKYYRWSKELIANAEEGFFPVYGTIKKPKRNELGFLILN
jgi:hypothetical protein